MVHIEHAANVEGELLEEFKRYFAATPCSVKRREPNSGISNALDWVGPALIAVWISKAFFDGFLKELGKDSAQQFKKLLSEAYHRLRDKHMRSYSLADIEQIEKGAGPNTVGNACPVLKLHFELTSTSKPRSMRLSCVFPSGLSEQQMQDAVESLTASLPIIIPEQSAIFENEHSGALRRAYVYVPSRGWLTDSQLIDEQFAKASKKNRKRKSKKD